MKELRIVNVLSEFDARLEAEHNQLKILTPEERVKHLDEMMLAVGWQTGQFLNMLLKAQGGKRILEIGTSIGYSTIWLAQAARENGGCVTTLECVASKQTQALENIRRAGLEDFVNFQLGDAVKLLENLPGTWDFVLLDLWKDLYIPCFDRFYEKLAPGAIVVADNITFPPDFRTIMKAYQEYVRAKSDLDSIEIDIGQGIELTRKEVY
ncbi:O-methyltransferase [Nostoc sphaeroides]|uniref:O-methyltransferase n=1 Tax=Nostoc sphaeroides CCNUC1 TaxID=2653204 RepID=A0A5P8WAT2_9NOSO|nr:O-methyltransferase [Nostoc sphaeroides]QFS49714.1 O-methyltransferase [Nostoc sphaeroides CCNUC1]